MAIHQVIYERLKEVAREGTLTNYGEIAPLAGLNMEIQADRNKIGEILGAISAFEHEHGKPMLSAIFVHADDRTPGSGFLNLARELRLHHGHDDLTELEFFVNKVKKVYRYGGNHQDSI